MKQFLIYIVGVAMLFLLACNSDNDSALNDGNSSVLLHVEVCMSDFVNVNTNGIPTRATDNARSTAFEKDDRIGVIVLDKENKVLSDNIPYKYDSKAWGFDSDNGEGKTPVYSDIRATPVTYLAYFPYSREADGVTSIEGLKSKFQPKFDQRSKEDYRASDLLVWSVTSLDEDPLKTLNIAFKHAYSSLSLSVQINCIIEEEVTTYPTTLTSDVNFTVGEEIFLAYKADDASPRIIISPQASDINARWFCTYRAKTYGGTVEINTVAENSRYILAQTLGIGNIPLDNVQVGDFYCKNGSGNGYLIPGEASPTSSQQSACRGVVFSTNIDRIGKEAVDKLKAAGVDTPHALAIALTNATDNCRWGDTKIDENASGKSGEPFYENTNNLSKMYQNVDGYAETHWMIDKISTGEYDSNTYKAFSLVRSFNVTLPNKTTGWFLPSIGQWWDLLENWGGVTELQGYRTSTDGTFGQYYIASSTLTRLNYYFNKIKGAKRFDSYYWSSSEYGSYQACYVGFYPNNDALYLYNYSKGYDAAAFFRVRPAFAF